jgi:hypothetical protein
MNKKLFSISVAVVFAVVAFASMSAMASAAEFGNCNTALAGNHPPCAANKTFTAFPNVTPIAGTTKKAAATGNFELQNEANPANGITCTKLSGQGFFINGVASNGFTEQNLVFEGCTGVGALAFCQTVVSGTAQKINGTGKIAGLITAEAINGTEQEITPHGFLVTCTSGSPGGTVDLGTVTGAIKGQTVPAKPYELNFNKAKGEVFAGEASTQTGTSESAEAYKPTGKIYAKGGGGGAATHVLTLEKLGKKGGPEAPVGDEVAVSLEKGTEATFTKTENNEAGTLGGGAGVLSCGQSEMRGTIKANPEVGKGSSLIEFTTFTFANCKSTIGKAWTKTALEELPAFGETHEVADVGFTQGKNRLEFGVELGVEKAAGGEEICAFRARSVTATYANLDSEIKIKASLGGFGNVKECAPAKVSVPTWEAVYEPLQDESGARKGKRIVINE